MHPDLTAVRTALAGEPVSFALLEVRGERARVAPALSPDALYAQLGERLEEAWSLTWHLEHAEPPVVRCRLELLGQAREGLSRGGDLESARQLALTEAARAWGLLPERYAAPASWVDYDPDEGPNTAELEGGELDSPELDSAELVPETPPRDPQLERARQHIDDLMDQLRERELGKQASRVLVKHGGYGETVEDSRKVYAELKSLLRS